MSSVPKTRQDGSFFDHHRVEETIVELGARAEPDAVPVLPAIREGDQEGSDWSGVAVELELVVTRDVAAAFTDADQDVGPAAARAALTGIEQRRDPRIDADPGDVEEGPGAEHPCIDCARRAVDRPVNRDSGIDGTAERSGEAVSRAGGDQAERGARAQQRRSDLVDGAVATPHDHEIRAIANRGPRQLACVPGALGELNPSVKPATLERVRDQDAPLFRDTRIGAGARNRVDDGNDVHDSLL